MMIYDYDSCDYHNDDEVNKYDGHDDLDNGDSDYMYVGYVFLAPDNILYLAELQCRNMFPGVHFLKT